MLQEFVMEAGSLAVSFAAYAAAHSVSRQPWRGDTDRRIRLYGFVALSGMTFCRAFFPSWLLDLAIQVDLVALLAAIAMADPVKRARQLWEFARHRA